MPQDLYDIAHKLTDTTTKEAAEQFARLFKEVLHALPNSHNRAQFILHLRRELAKQGYVLSAAPEPVPFEELAVGEAFATINGRRGRKITEQKHHIKGQAVTYNATELHNPEHYLFIRPLERVHRLEKPAA